MPMWRVQIPEALERKRAPERLGPAQARILQRVQLTERPGLIKRGRGQTRINFTSGNAATIISGVLFVRRDGTKELAYGDDTGVWKLTPGVESAYVDADYT